MPRFARRLALTQTSAQEMGTILPKEVIPKAIKTAQTSMPTKSGFIAE